MYSRIIPGRLNRRAPPAGAGAFSGNFSSLFSAPYYFAQADMGLTYGSTPKATAGNTSTTVLTVTGSTPATPVPVLVKSTNTLAIGAGATFSIFYDGLGVTAGMVGVTPSVATPVALTGAGSGLSIAWSAGTSVSNDTWKLTAASNADQSGNGLTWSQASASLQPVVTAGANGHVMLLFDGVDDFYSSAFSIVAGAQLWMVFRQTTWVAFRTVIGCGLNINKQIVFQDGGAASPNLSIFNNGSGLASVPLTLGATGRLAAVFNAGSSSHKIGANAQVNGSLGAFVSDTGRSLACDRFNATPINFTNIEVAAWGEMPAQSYAAADTRAVSYWGAAV